ncbi:MAG: hypothetical protein K2X76_15325 [Sphingomonas sp.]|nr:hypothetical protein [Sphingomonas sp.]
MVGFVLFMAALGWGYGFVCGLIWQGTRQDVISFKERERLSAAAHDHWWRGYVDGVRSVPPPEPDMAPRAVLAPLSIGQGPLRVTLPDAPAATSG